MEIDVYIFKTFSTEFIYVGTVFIISTIVHIFVQIITRITRQRQRSVSNKYIMRCIAVSNNLNFQIWFYKKNNSIDTRPENV